ncbi:MAG TPA: sugar ABC transporter ATP-binding protein [Pseudonocardia sp.]|jgi:ribose transport system ATP-binding protein
MPALKCANLRKAFGGVPVLSDVTLSLEPGSVTVLAGENGAGKSTFMKIVAGLVKPDGGTVWLDDREVTHFDPLAAGRSGVAIIPQELTPIPDMTIWQNLYLGRELHHHGRLDIGAMVEGTRKILADFELELDPNRPVRELSTASVQLIEIAKHTAFEARVLLMDEPTSSLLDKEVEQLFTVVDRLRSAGVCVVYTTHKMAEIQAIADQVMVLRDGALITSGPIADFAEPDIVAAMIGREMGELFPARPPVREREPVLRVRNLTMPGAPRPVSFDVRPGEIVGLAGLVGAGRTEVLEAIFGVRRASGRVELDGRQLPLGKPPVAIRAGMALVPEDRKTAGLLPRMSVGDNTGLPSLGRFTRAGVVNRRRLGQAVEAVLARVELRFRNRGQPVGTLSGGNQQKVVLGRWLVGTMTVLLLDEPTRGVDVGARAELYRHITALAEAGIAILLVSSDIDEVINLAHRVLVMRDRRIVGEIRPTENTDAHTKEQILRLAMGWQQPDRGIQR